MGSALQGRGQVTPVLPWDRVEGRVQVKQLLPSGPERVRGTSCPAGDRAHLASPRIRLECRAQVTPTPPSGLVETRGAKRAVNGWLPQLQAPEE